MEEFNDFPIKVVNGSPIYIRDVGHVRDGFAPQTNIVRQDGSRAVLLTVLKAGNASTLAVVEGVRKLLPVVAATLPPELKIQPLADQSIFVRAAINGVIREAVIAACLTGLMILVFLGSWRSTLIIAVSIPLSILTSMIVLELPARDHQHHDAGRAGAGGGHPGGRRHGGRSRTSTAIWTRARNSSSAILDGAAQIAVPALVSTLSHLHRVPAHVLPERRGALPVRAAGRSGGVRDAGFLRPFADAGADAGDVPAAAAAAHGRSRNPLVLFQRAFERGFDRLRAGYQAC